MEMNVKEIADWKTHIPALNKVTPAYKVVTAAQSRTTWSDLSEEKDAQLMAMRDAYDNGAAGLSWDHPMWVRDVGYALQSARVIGPTDRDL
eukprot:3506235-Prymnesium_polylepis.1